MVVLLVFSFFVSLLFVLFLIHKARARGQHYDETKPQRFHVGEVPRVGGIGVLVGTVSGWVLAATVGVDGLELNVHIDWMTVISLLFVLFPTMCGGFYEDFTQRLAVLYRLVLSAISAALACAVLGASISRLGMPALDAVLLTTPWIGIALAFFAICGLPHAFNIIDGYNGLAGTVALLVCMAIAHVALQLGDRQLAGMVICLAGATAGFLFWNYPRGLIFAGDGGAYLWGVLIAIASIFLVQRHDAVSPWFPMLLLIYPVWETIFSIYRKLMRGSSPGVADALHFHQLIYRRIVRRVFHDDASRRMLMRNNRTSPYLWGFTLLTVLPAVLFWSNTPVLLAFCVLFALSYVAAYLAIIHFKVPRWLRR